MEEGDRRACFDKGWEAVGIARQNIAVRRRVDNRLKEGMKWKVAHLGSVEHKIGLQFNLRWSISCGVQRDQTAIKRRSRACNQEANSRKSRKFQVGTSFGSIHFAWTLNKKKKKRRHKQQRKLQSWKRIVRSPPIFGLSLPLTDCSGMSSRLSFGVYQNFRDLFGSS